MLSFLLIIVVIILAIVLGRKDREARQKLDYYSMSYRQGYWDGVRAAEQGVSSTNPDNESVQPTAPEQVAASTQSVVGQPPAPLVSAPHKDTHVTVNIALYVASLLFVGGISLFVKLFMPGSTAGFVWALIIAAAYYGAGLALYRSIPIVKPVAIAFVGTALAAMPYVGYLLHQSLVPDVTTSWFITSIACLVAYFYAAIRLNSELIGYALIIVLVSTADSFTGVLGASVLWFIVAVMIVGAAITFLATWGPAWLPAVLRRPFIITQHVLVPIAVLWSLLIWNQFSATDYAIVFAVATVYYAAAAVQSSHASQRRTWLWAAARGTLTVAAGFLAYEMSESMYIVGATLAAAGVIQAVLSTLLLPQRKQCMNQHELWLWLGLLLIVVASLFSAGEMEWARQVTIELAGLTVLAGCIALYLKRSEVLAFSIYGLTLLPFIGGYYWSDLHIASWVIVIVYTVLLLVMPFVRWKYVRSDNQTNISLVYAAQVAFSGMAIISGIVASQAHGDWWPVVAWTAVAVAAYVSTYLEKRRGILIGANCIAVVALFVIANALKLTDVWPLFFTAGIGFVGFYVVYWLLRTKQSSESLQRVLWGSAAVVGTILPVFGLFTSDSVLACWLGTLMAVAGAVIAYDDYEHRRLRFADLGLIAGTIGLQRCLDVLAPDISGLLYSHWWAALAFLLAYLHIRFGKKELAILYRIAALIAITVYGLSYVGMHDNQEWARVLFLVEHVGLVSYGLIRSGKLFTIWGAVGVTIAVLVMLPGFAFILLPLLGLGIIAAVVYVIARSNSQPPQKQ